MIDMQKRLNTVFDDLFGTDMRNALTDMDKLIMIVEELSIKLDGKAEENHQHTLI